MPSLNPDTHAANVTMKLTWVGISHAETPLISRVMREGDAAEVYMLTFNLRNPRDLRGSGLSERIMLVDALCGRVDADGAALLSASASATDERWDTALEYDAKVLTEIGVAPGATDDLRSRIYGALNVWDSPPSNIRDALAGARRVRMRDSG